MVDGIDEDQAIEDCERLARAFFVLNGFLEKRKMLPEEATEGLLHLADSLDSDRDQRDWQEAAQKFLTALD